MAKLPKYLHVECDFKPTDLDSKGCDGLYIKSLKCNWWGYPILIFKYLFRGRR